MAGYLVGVQGFRFGRQHAKNRLFLIGEKSLFTQELSNHFYQEFIRAFEKEITKFGIADFQYVPIKDLENVAPLLQKDEKAIGALYLLLLPVMQGASVLNTIRTQLGHLARCKIPTVAFDNNNVLAENPNFSFRFGKFVYSLGIRDIEAGVQVGKYLAMQGYHNPCYFSLFDESWCFIRLKGLNQGIQKLYGNKGRALAWNAKFNRWRFQQILLKLFKRQASLPIEHLISKGLKVGHKTWATETENVFNTIFNDLVDLYCRQIMEPLFQQAWANSQNNVWVCADPRVAVAALEFAEKHQIRVPQDLGIISIDNTDPCTVYSITSYDFQASRMGYLAAHCLLADIPIKRNQMGIVECPGHIIERGSVVRT